MRWLPILPLLLVLGATAQADVILGAQLGKQALAIRQTDSLGAVYENTVDTDAGLGLIVGVGQPGGGSRITGELNRFSIDSDVDLSLLSFGYTVLLPGLTLSSPLQLRPFLGAELGYGWLKVDEQTFFDRGSDSGLIYGARAGLNLAISDRAEIEAGVRYSVVGLDAELSGKIPGSGAEHFEAESNRGWWVGFNLGL